MKAAEQGRKEAQYNVAMMYHFGALRRKSGGFVDCDFLMDGALVRASVRQLRQRPPRRPATGGRVVPKGGGAGLEQRPAPPAERVREVLPRVWGLALDCNGIVGLDL